jgi:hypothetical protein
MSCTFCMDDLTADNMCQYRTNTNPEWKASRWCVDCVKIYLGSQHQVWIDGVRNATCPKELQRLIDAGPPIWLHDTLTFPVGEGEHVLEFKQKEETFSARLLGACEGTEREQLWDEMREVMYIKAQAMAKKSKN